MKNPTVIIAVLLAGGLGYYLWKQNKDKKEKEAKAKGTSTTTSTPTTKSAFSGGDGFF